MPPRDVENRSNPDRSGPDDHTWRDYLLFQIFGPQQLLRPGSPHIEAGFLDLAAPGATTDDMLAMLRSSSGRSDPPLDFNTAFGSPVDWTVLELPPLIPDPDAPESKTKSEKRKDDKGTASESNLAAAGLYQLMRAVRAAAEKLYRAGLGDPRLARQSAESFLSALSTRKELTDSLPIYQKAVHAGELTRAHLIILTDSQRVAPKERALIDRWLDEGKLNKAALTELLSWPKKLLTAFFTNQKDVLEKVLLPALRRGALDAESMQRLNSMSSPHRTEAEKFLARELADPRSKLSPKSLKNFTHLSQPEMHKLNGLAPTSREQLAWRDLLAALGGPSEREVNPSRSEAARAKVPTPRTIMDVLLEHADKFNTSNQEDLKVRDALVDKLPSNIFTAEQLERLLQAKPESISAVLKLFDGPLKEKAEARARLLSLTGIQIDALVSLPAELQAPVVERCLVDGPSLENLAKLQTTERTSALELLNRSTTNDRFLTPEAMRALLLHNGPTLQALEQLVKKAAQEDAQATQPDASQMSKVSERLTAALHLNAPEQTITFIKAMEADRFTPAEVIALAQRADLRHCLGQLLSSGALGETDLARRLLAVRSPYAEEFAQALLDGRVKAERLNEHLAEPKSPQTHAAFARRIPSTEGSTDTTTDQPPPPKESGRRAKRQGGSEETQRANGDRRQQTYFETLQGKKASQIPAKEAPPPVLIEPELAGRVQKLLDYDGSEVPKEIIRDVLKALRANELKRAGTEQEKKELVKRRFTAAAELAEKCIILHESKAPPELLQILRDQADNEKSKTLSVEKVREIWQHINSESVSPDLRTELRTALIRSQPTETLLNFVESSGNDKEKGAHLEHMREFNELLFREIEERLGERFGQPLREQCARLARHLHPHMLMEANMEPLLTGLNQGERAEVLKQLLARRPYLSQEGMKEIFTGIAEELRTMGAVKRSHITNDVTFITDSWEGRALAQLFRKCTGIEVHVRSASSDSPGPGSGPIVVFAAKPDAEQKARLEQIYGDRLKQLDSIHKVFEGANLYDLMLARQLPEYRERLLKRLGVTPDTSSGNETPARMSRQEFDALRSTLEQDVRLARERGIARSLLRAYRAKTSDLRTTYLDELMATGKAVRFYDSRSALLEARRLHTALQEKMGANPMSEGTVFVTFSALSAGSSKNPRIDSLDQTMFLYRLANGLLGKEHDERFLTRDQFMEKVNNGEMGSIKRVAVIDDTSITGTQMTDRMKKLRELCDEKGLKPELFFGTLIATHDGALRGAHSSAECDCHFVSGRTVNKPLPTRKYEKSEHNGTYEDGWAKYTSHKDRVVKLLQELGLTQRISGESNEDNERRHQRRQRIMSRLHQPAKDVQTRDYVHKGRTQDQALRLVAPVLLGTMHSNIPLLMRAVLEDFEVLDSATQKTKKPIEEESGSRTERKTEGSGEERTTEGEGSERTEGKAKRSRRGQEAKQFDGFRIKNFGEVKVTDNVVIWRGGEIPRRDISDGVAEQLKREGVEVIIDLRTVDERASSQKEAEWCKDRFRYVSWKQICEAAGLERIPLTTHDVQTNPQYLRAAADYLHKLTLSLDEGGKPAKVYVHCVRGQDRTGAVMRTYQHLFGGLTEKEANREMYKYHGIPGGCMFPKADSSERKEALADNRRLILETALDKGINTLAKKLAKARRTGHSEEARALEERMSEILLKEARAMAKQIGIPTELITKQSVQFGEPEEGNRGEYSILRNEVVIDPHARAPLSALRHELKHMDEAIRRTALAKAAPDVFAAQLLQSVLNNVGSGETRAQLNESGKIGLGRRAALDTDGRAALRAALNGYLQGAKRQSSEPVTEAEVGRYIKTLKTSNTTQYQALMKAFGGGPEAESRAIHEMTAEIAHFHLVKERSIIPDSELTAKSTDSQEVKQTKESLRKQISEKQLAYERSGRETYGGLQNHPEMSRLTRGLSHGTTSIWDDSGYESSPREFAARRAGLVEELRQLVADLRRSANGEKSMRCLAQADPRVQRVIGEIANQNLIQSVVQSLDKARQAETTQDTGQAQEHFRRAEEQAQTLLERLSLNDPHAKTILEYVINKGLSEPEKIPIHLRPLVAEIINTPIDRALDWLNTNLLGERKLQPGREHQREMGKEKLATALREGAYDATARQSFAEQAELFNLRSGDLTIEKLQRELLQLFINNTEQLRGDKAFQHLSLKTSEGKAELVFSTTVDGQPVTFTPLYREKTDGKDVFVYMDEHGRKQTAEVDKTQLEARLPQDLIDKVNRSGTPAARSEALAEVEGTLSSLLMQVDSINTRQQRLADVLGEGVATVGVDSHQERLEGLSKLDRLRAEHTAGTTRDTVSEIGSLRTIIEASGINLERAPQGPAERGIFEFENGQLKVGDPTRPETLKPLDQAMKEKIEQYFQERMAREKADLERERARIKRLEESRKISPEEAARLRQAAQAKHDDNMRTVGRDYRRYHDPQETRYRAEMNKQVEAAGRKIAGRIGGGAIGTAAVALSFFIVANYAFGHQHGKPLDGDTPVSASDLRRENRRELEVELSKGNAASAPGGGTAAREEFSLTGSDKPLPNQKLIEDNLAKLPHKNLPFPAHLRAELERALADPEKLAKDDSYERLRDNLRKAIKSGQIRAQLTPLIKAVLETEDVSAAQINTLKEELGKGLFAPQSVQECLLGEAKKLKTPAPEREKFKDQAAVEDQLISDRAHLKLSFDPSLRKHLEKALTDPTRQRLELDHLSDRLYVALNNQAIRPEIREHLNDYLDNKLKRSEDLETLKREVAKGIFRPDLLEKALERKALLTSDSQLYGQLQKTVQSFLPLLRQGAVEDSLATSAERAQSSDQLPFPPGIRKDLCLQIDKQLIALNIPALTSEKLSAVQNLASLPQLLGDLSEAQMDKLVQTKATIPTPLKRSIEEGLANGQFKRQYEARLGSLIKGELSLLEALQLKAESGLRSTNGSGLLKPELLKAALEKELEARSWGPVSQAAYAQTVQYATADAGVQYRFLGREQFAYLPSNGPIEVPAGLNDFREFQNRLRDGKLKVDLQIDVQNSPSKKDIEKLYATIRWNSEAQKVLEAGFKEKDYRELKKLLHRMDRPQWIPREKLSGDSREWARRLQEVAPIASTFSQVEGTRAAIVRMMQMHEKNPGWIAQVFGEDVSGVSNKTKWMEEAMQELRSLQNDRGGLLLPTELGESKEKKDRLAKLQAWLDRYQDKTKAQYLRLMDNVQKNRFVIYGDRPKMPGLDPVQLDGKKLDDYNLVRDNFWSKKIEKKVGEELLTADGTRLKKTGNKKNSAGETIDVWVELDKQGNKRQKDGKDVTRESNFYEVTTETVYAKSHWFSAYDAPFLCGEAGRVRNFGTAEHPGTAMVFEDGELVPVLEPTKNNLMLVEAQNLGSYKSSEASAYYLAKGVEIGVDVAMTVTGTAEIRAGMKAAQLATKVAETGSKALYKEMMKAAVKRIVHGGAELALGGSGLFLNNAKARYDSQVGQTLNQVRGAAFVAMAGMHLAGAFSGGVGYVGGIKPAATMEELAVKGAQRLAAVKGVEAGKELAGIVPKAWGDLSTWGKVASSGANAKGLFVQGYFLAVSGKEFGHLTGLNSWVFKEHQGDSLENTRTNFLGRKAHELISGMENRTGSELYRSERGAAHQADFGTHFLRSCASTLAQGKDKVTSDRINKIMEDVVSVLRLEPAQAKRQSVVDSLTKTFFEGKTNEEKQAAAIALLHLQRQSKEGKVEVNAAAVDQALHKAFERLRSAPLSQQPAATRALAEQLAGLSKKYDEATPEGKIASAEALWKAVSSPENNEKLKQLLGQERAAELGRVLTVRCSLNYLEQEQTAPDANRKLVAARARLGYEQIPGQEYAGVCEQVLKDSSASADSKMQAIAGLGISMWAAQDAERELTGAAEQMSYWSRSNGRSYADLQAKLSAIANATSGEENPDLRAFAANVLFALNRDDTSDRAFLLNCAFKDWEKHKGDGPGRFATHFIAEMTKDLKFHPPKNPRDYSQAKAHQLMAASVLATLKPPSALQPSWPETQKLATQALADCVSFRCPAVALQALALLRPDRIEQLPAKEQERLRWNAIYMLSMHTAADGSNQSALKYGLLPLLPELLARGNTSQRQTAVEGISSLLNPENKNYAGTYPELRIQAVETLAAMGDTGTERILRSLLEFKAGKPIEPSADVRIAALQNLHRALSFDTRSTNEEFKRFLSRYLENERDPRAHQIARGLEIIREIRPLPTLSDKAKKDQREVPYDEHAKPDALQGRISAFLTANFPNLNQEEYDERLKARRKKEDEEFDEKHKLKGHAIRRATDAVISAPKDLYNWLTKEERPKTTMDFWRDLEKLSRWAGGQFGTEKLSLANGADEKAQRLSVQKDAIRSLALIIRHNGNARPGGKFDVSESEYEYTNPLTGRKTTQRISINYDSLLLDPDSGSFGSPAPARISPSEIDVEALLRRPADNYLRDSDRNEATGFSARRLADLCKSGQPEVRVMASRFVQELIKSPRVSAQARLELLRGLDHLYDWSAENLKSENRSQALITKEEAAQITAAALEAHRKSYLPEDKVGDPPTHNRHLWEADVRASRRVQSELMLRLVWHENRQSRDIIKQTMDKTKDGILRRQAELMLARTEGIQVRELKYKEADEGKGGSRTVDPGLPAEERGRRMQATLDAVRNGGNAHTAVEALFRGTYGRRFEANDARMPILKAALNHNDELVRGAAAFAILSRPAHASGEQAAMAIKTVAELARYSDNPHVKTECQQRMKALQQTAGRGWSMAKIKADKPNATAEEKKALKDWSDRSDFISKANRDAVRDRAGVKDVFARCSLGAQNASIEQRVEELTTLVAQKASGDPVRVIFNSCLARQDDPELKKQGLIMAKANDARLPLLKELATCEKERIRVAANMMLARFSPSVTDRQVAINALAGLESTTKSSVLRDEAGRELATLKRIFAQPQFSAFKLDAYIDKTRKNNRDALIVSELMKDPAANAEKIKKLVPTLAGFDNPIMVADDPRLAILKAVAARFKPGDEKKEERNSSEAGKDKQLYLLVAQALLESNAGRLRDLEQYPQMIEMLEESVRIARARAGSQPAHGYPELSAKLAILRDGLLLQGQNALRNNKIAEARDFYAKALKCEEERAPAVSDKVQPTEQMRLIKGIIDNLPTQADLTREEGRQELERLSRERAQRKREAERQVNEILAEFPAIKDIQKSGIGTNDAVDKMDDTWTALFKAKKHNEARNLAVAYLRLHELDLAEHGGRTEFASTTRLATTYVDDLVDSANKPAAALDLLEELTRLTTAYAKKMQSFNYPDEAKRALKAHADTITRALANIKESTSIAAGEKKQLEVRLKKLELQATKLGQGQTVELEARTVSKLDVQTKIDRGLPMSVSEAVTGFERALATSDSAALLRALERVIEPSMPPLQPNDARLRLLEKATTFGKGSELTGTQIEIRRRAELTLCRFHCGQLIANREFDKAIEQAEKAVKLTSASTSRTELTDEAISQLKLLRVASDAKASFLFSSNKDYAAAEHPLKRILEIELLLSKGESTADVRRAFSNLTNIRLWQVQETFKQEDWQKGAALRTTINERHIADVNRIYKKELDKQEADLQRLYERNKDDVDNVRAFHNLLDTLIFRGRHEEAAKLALERAKAHAKGTSGQDSTPIERALHSLKVTALSLDERKQHEVAGRLWAEYARYLEKEVEWETEHKHTEKKYGKGSYADVLKHQVTELENFGEGTAADTKATLESIGRLWAEYVKCLEKDATWEGETKTHEKKYGKGTYQQYLKKRVEELETHLKERTRLSAAEKRAALEAIARLRTRFLQ